MKAFWNRNKSDRNFMIGFVLSVIMLVFICVGFFYTPYDPNKMNAATKLAGFSWKHPFGCDNFGRDLFSRVMTGAGTTFLISLGTVGIGVVGGMLVGALTGYFGGIVDDILMRINDAIFAFPSILLALLFISLFGGGRMNVMWALGVAFIPSFARVVRGEFLKQRNLDYVKSARLAGASHMRIMFVHILPNIFPVLLSTFMIGFNNAVLAEASMSYIGIGVQPPDASLGSMLSEAQSYFFTAPWYALAPGCTIVLLILGFALMAEGIKKRA